MNERDIFLAAIEISDPQERAAYVEEACGGDATLRSQVEALLKTYEQTSQFLETPAVATDSAVYRTVLTDASDTDEDSGDERVSGEAEFRKYLEPATRPGWLGRLAHYEIEEILGRGAFGIVAKAFDEKLHRVVAIKLMSPELASTSPPRKRFLREARTAAAVTHENIVAIHAVEEEPIPYLVMEYISGQTLQQRMDGHGPLEVPDILSIGQQIASGLAAAHAVNLIHRDIKPSNILLSDGLSGRAKISDFGLARAMDDASMTQSGMIAGTPMYMAPEQARGETLDHRADLFSLGSVLYQMAGGRPPFRAANTVAVLKRVCEDTPRPLGDVLPGTPGWLETIIFRLLEKDREDRYQTAQEVADLLARCQRELEHNGKVTCVKGRSSIAETQVLKAETRTSSGPRKQTIGWLIVGAMAVIFGIGLLMMYGEKSAPDHGVVAAPSDTTSVSTSETAVNSSESTGWHGWPADAPLPAIAPFDAAQARKHQEAWAKYLGVPVEKELSLGKDKDGKDVALAMVLIPPGEFMIGATDDEQRKWLSVAKAEHPNAKEDAFATIYMEDQRFVRITKPFWLSKFEFTTGQFRRFVESKDYRTDAETNGEGAARPAAGKPFERLPELNWNNWGKISVDAGPVVNVSWNDAAKCCEWLSIQHPDLAFSLPTEAQWEFACRAGTRNSLYDCDTSEELREYAQFGDEVQFIQRPGQLRPNAFGLYDMLGNVTEWCSNWLAGYAASQTDDPAGPSVPGKYALRAVRGGSFMHPIWKVRSSKRDFYTPDNCFFDRGFRVSAAITENVIREKSRAKVTTATHVEDAKAKQSSTDGPPSAIAPFDAAQAKAHQEAWANYLGVPVEYENSIGMKFRLIPPGEFLMGSTPEEIEAAFKGAGEDQTWRSNIQIEGPQHKVVLTQPIYVCVTEVTQTQYELVMGTNPSHFSASGEGRDAVDGLETGNYPAEMISWNDAAEFCTKLSQQEQLKPFYFRSQERVTPLEGTGYRLPTEAEWEYACRAGTTTRFWSGDQDNDLLSAGWFGSNAGRRTHAVGELRANPFGLSDMHGNVWEWVQDNWDPAFYGQFLENAVIDPYNPFSAGSQRVLRGGQWAGRAYISRSSSRSADISTSRYGHFGFRVVLTVDAVKQLWNGKQAVTENTKATPRDRWPADAPPPAIAPFDAAQAQAHQEAWAKYLGIPVEYENSLGMKFRLIPPGEFQMGSTPKEIEADLQIADEDQAWRERIQNGGPQHKVILTQPIYLGVTEVRQAIYEQVMGMNPSLFSPTGDGQEVVKNLDYKELPVETVSWNDAAEFCSKLSMQEHMKPFYARTEDTVEPLAGTGYRLPTEAEWEFACRAGTTTRFWCGDQESDLPQAGWVGENSEGRTHGVGELRSNPFGLFDMHGNVWEWVEDGWDPEFYGQSSSNSAVNPRSPFSASSLRLTRGGDWYDYAIESSSSRRFPYPATNWDDGLGFRVVLVLDVLREAVSDNKAPMFDRRDD